MPESHQGPWSFQTKQIGSVSAYENNFCVLKLNLQKTTSLGVIMASKN